MSVRALFESIRNNAPWTERALCAKVDPELFFPGAGEQAREAKSVCLECPVRTECLQYALDKDERFGVWGGLRANERRSLNRGCRVSTSVLIKCINGHDQTDPNSRTREGRCKECDRLRRKREYDRLARLGLKGRGQGIPHGRYTRYKAGCRCDECAQARREYDYRRRKRALRVVGGGVA